MALDWKNKTKWLEKRMGISSDFDMEVVRKKKKRRKKGKNPNYLPNANIKPNVLVKKQAEKRALLLRINATKQEVALQYILNAHQIDYDFQYIIYLGGFYYITDFLLPSHNIIIEVDGQQHYKGDYIAKDAKRDKYLTALGYKVIRFPNSVVDKDQDYVVDVLKRNGVC
jgi:very-short-patch-repair endonuclease